MARVMTEAERERFLAEPHVGVVSVAADDGRPPHTVPVWYAYSPGGQLTFSPARRAARRVRHG